jgi:hypothetical protein
MWLVNLISRAPAGRSLSDSETDWLIHWSIDRANEHLTSLPSFFMSNMIVVIAWHAIPVMVGLKHKGIEPPVSQGLLDALDTEITKAAMETLFNDEANSPEYREIATSMVPVVRRYIIFWITVFRNKSARTAFSDEKFLAARLTTLIKSPDYELQDTLSVDEEEDVEELSKAFAELIVHSFRTVSLIQ